MRQLARVVAVIGVVLLAAGVHYGQGTTVTQPTATVGARELTILRFFKLGDVAKITVTRTPNADLTTPGARSIDSTDPAAVAGIVAILDKIPAKGTVNRKIDPKSERLIVTLADTDGKSKRLTFYRNKLQAPITADGMFYGGPVEAPERELLQAVRELLREQEKKK